MHARSFVHLVTTEVHMRMQAAKMNPMAVALSPTRTALNHARARRVAQNGIMAKIRITPGPKRPR